MQKGQTGILILAGIVLVGMLVGGAYYLGKSTTPKPTPAPVVTSQTSQPSPIKDASPVPTGSAETANWKTYISKIYGFSFDYPNSWILKEETRQDNINVYLYDETKVQRISFISDLNTPDCDTKTAEREGIKYEYVTFQIGDIMEGNSNFCGKDKYRITLKDKDNKFVVLYFDFVNSPREEIAKSILKSVKGLYATAVPID